jgi:pimeloyl-ACP methyl ester carboxylesterase
MPTVVFVHGINSSCESAFSDMVIRFRRDTALDDWQLQFFDYDFNDSIRRNGARLREYLNRLPSREAVVIIAHSMGGLVARFACLTGGAPSRARRLIMLATPNKGAITALQLTLLAQGFVTLATTMGLYFRKQGLRDLTRVYQLFQEASLNDHLNFTTTEYVTIPATYFHKLQSDVAIDPRALGGWHARFGVINATALLSRALTPLLTFDLEKPHDGIVERRSVKLFPDVADDWSGSASEQMGSIKVRDEAKKTYANVWEPVLDSLHHINVTQNGDVIDIVKTLVLAASLPDWIATHDAEPRMEVKR